MSSRVDRATLPTTCLPPVTSEDPLKSAPTRFVGGALAFVAILAMFAPLRADGQPSRDTRFDLGVPVYWGTSVDGTDLACDPASATRRCTFVQNSVFMSSDHLRAARDGRLTRVRVASARPVTARVVLVRTRRSGGDWQVRVVRRGPNIQITGQAQGWTPDDIVRPQTIPLSLRVRKGEQLALQAPGTSALSCGSDLQGDDTLVVGSLRPSAFVTAGDAYNCQLLLFAVATG